MKTETTEAIVLRRTNYGEADRIVQISTPNGKRAVMARGVRRPKSKLAGGIELLSLSEVVIRHGRGDLATLVQARMSQFYCNILANYDRLQFAYEALKLVARASETVDEPDWFFVLKQTISALDDDGNNFATIKTWFYLQYSKLLGDELSLWRDTNGDEIKSGTNYQYDIAQKGLVENKTGLIGENHIKFLRVLQTQPLKAALMVGGVQKYVAECANVAICHAAVK